MPTIRKRNSKWQAQVRRLGSTPITKTFGCKRDAVHWARAVEARLDLETAGLDLRSLQQTTLAELLRRYEQEITPSKRSRKLEACRLNWFQKQPLAHLTLAKITPGHFARFRDQRLKKVSRDTVRRELGIIRHCFEVARREWGYPLGENPVALIKFPSPNPGRTRRLLEGEEQLLLEGAAAMPRTPYLLPMIELALATAMRRGELLSLTSKSVSLPTRQLELKLTKNGYARTIPLSEKAVSILEPLVQQGGRLFEVSETAHRLAWTRLTERCQIRDLRFHDLTHEAISRLFERGLTIPEVALVSGHRDIRMLFRYTHLRAEDVVHKLN